MLTKVKNPPLFYSKIEVINSTRMLTILSAILFLMFAIVDIWAMPSSLSEALITRGIVVFFLILTYLSTFNTSFYNYKDSVLSGIFLIASTGIEYMIYKATPSDHAYSVYFVGLVLILMTLYSWSYLDIIASLCVTACVISGYIAIELYLRPTTRMLSIAELFTNLFFISAAVVIGIVARLMRDQFLRENHKLQKSLAKALINKTEEAESNAYLANHDALTGLTNRRHIIKLLEEALETAKRESKFLVIMFIDLNGFKQINDIYGHSMGDKVLKVIAQRLSMAIRDNDYLARLGGDEYLIGLLVEKQELSIISSLVEKYRQVISSPMKIDGNNVKVGASIGISAYPMHGNKIRVLMDIADMKMYQAKKASHNEANTGANGGMNKENQIVIFPRSSRRI